MFEQCLYFNTTSLARKLEREWSAAFRPFGLTPPQAFLLRIVVERPGALQSELAAAMNISRSTATRTLDGLERLGLIRRDESENDGRELEIRATASGMEIKVAVDTASGEVTRRLKRKLGADVFARTVGDIRALGGAL